MADVRTHFLICTGGGCIASGALELSEAVRAELKARDLAGEVEVIETGCLGPCVQGPVALVYPDGVSLRSSRSTSSRGAWSSAS